MSVSPSIREVLARRIAGEIILSGKPGSTMRKWRELFAVSQITLSEKMLLSGSVISDYESGRRKSPGAKVIRRFGRRPGCVIRQSKLSWNATLSPV